MKTTRMNSVIALALMLAAVVACSYSSANLSALKTGRDRTVSEQTSDFERGDIIYAVATVSNAPGKVKVRGRLIVEDVPGQQTGPVPGLEKTLELDGSGNVTFTFTPPSGGWPGGKYKIEAIMMNEKDEQKDQKAVSISVS